MKKVTIIAIVAVVAVIAIWAISGYNSLVGMDENVSNQWANVETQYQRRADLIPNLVNTVKGYAAHEKETLEGVIAARSQATQIKVDPTDLTPEKLAEYQKAQGQLATRTSWSCRLSSRVRKTASTWPARTSTTRPRPTTPPSAVSPRTSWPASSASTSAPTSRHKRERKSRRP